MSLFTDPGVTYQTRLFHLKDLARHLQWQYTPTLPWQSLPYAESFQLFLRGTSQTVTNVLNGMAGAVQVIVFDYSFAIQKGLGIPIGSAIRVPLFGGSGEDGELHNQTVAMFGASSINLPAFQLQPRTVKQNLMTIRRSPIFTGSIDFSNYPKFAGEYFVTGSDEPAIRRLFTGPLINALEANPGWSLEGGGGQFFFYREDEVVIPERIQWLVQTGQQVLKLMETPESYATMA